jgi:hypothetical protein
MPRDLAHDQAQDPRGAGWPTNFGKRYGVVHGETEKHALANAQKEFAKTESEKMRIYLRAQ